jgi:anti-sigma regulatory factor (Ser/Thr protein kinase)
MYRHKLDEAKQLKHFDRIQASIKHMTDLVSDVLFLSRADFEKLEFQPQPIDLVSFFNEVVEELQVGIGNAHHLTFTSVGECIYFDGDAKLLRQILTNLISNAIKYSPNGGPVSIRLTCQDNQVIFQVSDQGIGIPPEDQENLFESFTRARNVGTIAGTGLGLSIVKKCVDLHNGQIAVESQVGVGTTFTVSLPFNRDWELWNGEWESILCSLCILNYLSPITYHLSPITYSLANIVVKLLKVRCWDTQTPKKADIEVYPSRLERTPTCHAAIATLNDAVYLTDSPQLHQLEA